MTRYAAHEALSSIGPGGQQRIQSANVLLVGLGGLGCPTAMYLAAAGVGSLSLCDFDRVAQVNLNRQLLYAEDDVDRDKVDVAATRLKEMNPQVAVIKHRLRLDEATAPALVAEADMVIDGSDNFGTRLALSRACLARRKPLVMGSVVRMEGQLAVFRHDLDSPAPCYRCLYGDAPDQLEDCAGQGVLGPVAGMIGAAMATQALLCLAGAETTGHWHVLDARIMQWQSITVAKNPQCSLCGQSASAAPDSTDEQVRE